MKCVIKFLFGIDDVIDFKIYLRSNSKAMGVREKEEKTKIQKSKYLEIKKSFLDEMKNIFYSF